MSWLDIENLTCAYGTNTVFRDLSLQIERGTVWMLLGSNGSGKTTLLKALMRQLAPVSGSIRLEGQPLSQINKIELSRRVTMMAQSERRDWPLTVEESVRLGRAPHRGWMMPYTREDFAQVEHALERTGMLELRTRPITELSGGEWRRMSLARALAQEAEILLLDEPTAGLDLRYQLEVLSQIRQMAAEQQMTFLVSIHDLNHAALYGDRFALLGEHQLLASGTSEEVLQEKLLERGYGIPVEIVPHPIHRTPLIVPHPAK
ncbi:MAG TPA: ABC transporter ATP-binding protein [Planctomycetaceae bacterium]|nr:ABC transporter ATP-binding protein [Planctomycetaceae bacterium]